VLRDDKAWNGITARRAGDRLETVEKGLQGVDGPRMQLARHEVQ
jgi:hypothetical protein